MSHNQKIPASGSAERSLALLQTLSRSGRSMSLAELADSMGLPKATLHRLCSRLLSLDFLVRDVDERYYSLGSALNRLAFDTLAHGTQSRLRHNVLSELVDEVGETCNFTAPSGASVVYLDRVEAARPWRLTLDIGVQVPMHCTASGKLFLSMMSAEKRHRLLTNLNLAALTRHTITRVDELEDCLAITRNAGYAVDNEEFVIGLVALAVPVYDAETQPRAAIAMHCPVTDVSQKQMLKKLPALKMAAARMASLLELY